MHGINPRRRRMIGIASLAVSIVFGTLSFASLPAGAQTATTSGPKCPVVSIWNPNPGDNLSVGDYILSGMAFDPTAPAGTSGVSKIDFFLGQREAGGTFLGSAVPGTTAEGDQRSPVDPRFYSLKVTLPAINRTETFAAYALSSVTGQQTAVSFSVFVGTPPIVAIAAATPTPIPTSSTVTTTCPGAPAPAAPAAPATPATAVAAAPRPANNGNCPFLTVGSPNPGDNILAGKDFFSGSAFDPAAGGGASGISRIDFFLGRREEGGLFLGSATTGTGANTSDPRAYMVEVTIPSVNRGDLFVAYAISAITGQESAVMFPVFVGVPPKVASGAATPTPIPATSTLTSTCR